MVKCLLVATLVLLSFSVTAWSVSGWNRTTGPRLKYQERITVEPVEQGREALTEFALFNDGGSLLRVYDISTGCGCAAPELIVEANAVSFRELRLQPGEGTKARLRWSVRGNAGEEQHTHLHFKTNDPTSEEGDIDFVMPTLLGGVHTQPLELPSLEVVSGHPVVRRIRVINRSALPYRVVGVELSDLAGVATARLMSAGDDLAASDDSGHVIGAVEVTPAPTTVGPFSGYLQVNVEGGVSRMVRLPVTGNVVSAVALSPTTVTLPRRTREGLTYQANVICRDRTGDAIDVSGVEAIGPVRIQVQPTEIPTAARVIQVEWTDRAAEAGEHEVPIRIKHARTGVSEVAYLRVSHRRIERE